MLRSVAPTKLVDGSWLYGLLPHWQSPRLADLVRTYVEELGEGAVDKNHVVLYRNLLASHALDPLDDLPDALYEQALRVGATSLSIPSGQGKGRVASVKDPWGNQWFIASGRE